MKRLVSLIFILIIAASGLNAQKKSFMSYYELNDFFYTSPGAFKFGLYGFSNPGVLNYLTDSDLLFAMTNKNYVNPNPTYGLFLGGPNSGGGAIRINDGNRTLWDYRYSFSFGNRELGFGIGYGFSGENKSYFKRSNLFNLGAIYRPNPYLSLGLQYTMATANHDKEAVAELAVRPIKNYPLTFFADAAMFDDQNIKEANWSAGISYEFLKGIRLSGRYFNTNRISVGLDVSFGEFGVGSQVAMSDKGDFRYPSYFVRLGALDRTIFGKDLFPFSEVKRFIKLDLSGTIKYTGFALFDDSKTLYGLLDNLEKIKKNKGVQGVVINATNISAGREMLWEIREKLAEVRTAGKKVYIFIDRADINLYHFASVADKVIMDELGGISMEGYMLGRSFYKKLLENSGIGFEELRYFKYKSAVENFSRDKMSEADKEQRQALVDGWYAISRKEVSESRKFSPEGFDSLVSGNIIYSYKDAKEKNLVDLSGRWNEVDKVVKSLAGDKTNLFDFVVIASKNQPVDDKWGEKKKAIAIIYAIGECAMDQGIKARKLVKDIEAAYKNQQVKAIVLRVDSPGGDALASDYIAEVIKKNKDKKPLVVSQGAVAGSGGYWLSMYGNKIVAAPMTITGSIGVISGRIYDKGLKDSLGISVDIVKKGKFVDMMQSFELPLIGIGLPVRNYNDEEKVLIEKYIKDMYKEFVQKVADGRNKQYDEIEKLAQGRVYTGIDGKSIGLVDELGGLETAIKEAKKLGKIEPDEDVNVYQYPAPELFDFSSLLAGMLNADMSGILAAFNTKKDTNILDYLKFRMQNNSQPMPVMPIEYQDLIPKN